MSTTTPTRSTRRPPLSDEERAERRRQEQELTERAVAQLRSTTGWQNWVKVRSQIGCRRYSFRNQLLIAFADPTATRVAGFRAWLNLSYCVRRGETARIRVWAPNPPSKKKLDAWRKAGANPADKPKTYFRLEPVFSAEQVEPLPPPAQAGAARSADRGASRRQSRVGAGAARAARRRAGLHRRLPPAGQGPRRLVQLQDAGHHDQRRRVDQRPGRRRVP